MASLQNHKVNRHFQQNVYVEQQKAKEGAEDAN